MAFAIASGLSPDRGLFTAIVGGFHVSAFGGSRFQIGGPAGAFIVLVFSIVQRQGYEGLALATMMAGVIILVLGFMRGARISNTFPFRRPSASLRHCVIIFASQLKELLGLDVPMSRPAAPKLTALWEAMAAARGGDDSALTIAVIVGLRRFRPIGRHAHRGRGLFNLERRFISTSRPLARGLAACREACRPLRLPAFDLRGCGRCCPTLWRSPCWADRIAAFRRRGGWHDRAAPSLQLRIRRAGRRQYSSAIFGGMPVTGAIARTATNVRAGAKGRLPACCMRFLLIFMPPPRRSRPSSRSPRSAPCSRSSPGTWRRKEEFIALRQLSRGDALVLLATFLLTIFEDLTIGIGVGVTLGAFLSSIGWRNRLKFRAAAGS